MPNNRSPLRKGEPLLPPRQRLELLAAAIEHEKGLALCDLEVHKPGLSYTVETLEALHEQDPDVSWNFLIGADSLQTLDRWVRIDALSSLARFLVVARTGFDLEGEAMALFQRAPFLEHRMQLLHDSRRMDCSATEVRSRVAEGRSIRFLVPDAVQELIASRGYWTR